MEEAPRIEGIVEGMRPVLDVCPSEVNRRECGLRTQHCGICKVAFFWIITHDMNPLWSSLYPKNMHFAALGESLFRSMEGR